MRSAFAFAAAIGVVAALGGVAACANSGDADSTIDAPEAGLPDALVIETGSTTDSGTIPDAAPPDASDKTAPTGVSDLAGTAPGATSVALTWTAPSDDSGHLAAYELRYATTPITTEAELMAATAVTPPPTPGMPGAAEKLTVTKLLPETAYHFAIRARDAAGNWGPISNDATVTTKATASFQINEVAVSNAAVNGYDFIELTATKAGSAEGIELRQLSTSIYKLGALDVAVGDKVVVHMTGLPGPTGFAQEDTTKSKTSSTAAFASTTAYDVYASTSGLTATDNVLSVYSGTTSLDAIVFANRDAAVATATMTAFAAAKTENAWNFAVTPADGVNDCDSEKDAVNVATSAVETTCGGFKSIVAAGISLNRRAGADTNTKADFYLAAQSPGADNTAVPAPSVIGANAANDTSVDLTFDQEIAPASVASSSFTITGLNVTAATGAFNHVALVTDTQTAGGYDVAIAPTVTNLQGVAPSPLTARFCGFSTVGALVTLSELNVNLAGGSDLIELTVTRGGSLTGFTLRSNPTAAAGSTGTLLATLPAICGAVGDVVVVHLAPAAAPADSETVSKTQLGNATYAQNYDTAWDVRGGSGGIGYTDQVITIRNPDGSYLEAVAFSDGGTTAAGYRSALAFAQASGLWTPANCGGAACDDASTPTAAAVAASWVGLDTTAAGNSIHRTGATNDASSWAVGPSSFGLGN